MESKKRQERIRDEDANVADGNSLRSDAESNFLRACRIEKSENIGVGWPTGVYDRARTGHVPGAMYLDESHGNSARAYSRTRTHTHIHARI